MGWKDTIQEGGGDGAPSGWRSTVRDEGPASSPVTAVTTGALSLGGFGPKIAALGDTAMKAITGVEGPLAGGSLSDLARNYHNTRDELQGDFATAEKAHPVLSGVGKIAGTAAALGPLGEAATSTAGLLGTGAAQGIGSVNIDRPEDISRAATAAGKGALTNLVMGTIANRLAVGTRTPKDFDPELNLGHAALEQKLAAEGPSAAEGLIATKAGPVVQSVSNAVGGGLEHIGASSKKEGALGAVLGGYEGFRHGGLKGAATGALVGALAGPAIGGLGRAIQATPEVFGAFAPILEKAAARGAASLETTDAILQKMDPEYRKMREQMPSGKP